MIKTRWILCLLATALNVGCNSQTGDSAPTTVTLGALLPLSGAWSSYGQASEAALRLAVTDVNAFLEDTAATVRIDLRVADTRTDAETAFQELSDLSAGGINVVIGPMSSEALARVQPLAARLDMLIVSPSSGAPSLAGNDDTVFRLRPDDTEQADVIVAAIQQRNLDALILFARDSLSADELSTALRQRFTDTGGAILDTIRFGQDDLTSRDFRENLRTLSASVARAVDDFGTDGVGVCLLSYGEGVQIFRQAGGDAVLSSIPWFGTDGFAVNESLLGDAEAVTFAQAVFYTAPMYDGKDVDPQRRELVAGPLTGALERTPDGFAYLAYDSVWLAALTISQVGGATDAKALARALPAITEVYNGATGRITLNDAGDRETGTYFYWSLVDSNGTAEWQSATAYTDGALHLIDTNGVPPP